MVAVSPLSLVDSKLGADLYTVTPWLKLTEMDYWWDGIFNISSFFFFLAVNYFSDLSAKKAE